MATTWQQLIYQAFEEANIVDVGSTPSSTQRDNAFEDLKKIISSWSAEQLTCYNHVTESFSLSSGTMTYTWASGGTFNSARPVKVTGATAVSGVFQRAMEVLPMHEARKRTTNPDGATVALPSLLGWDQGYTSMNILIFPPPNASPGTVVVNSIKPITEPSSVSDNIALPPGWELALQLALAVKLQQKYDGQILDGLGAQAQSAKAALVQVNELLLEGTTQPAAA